MALINPRVDQTTNTIKIRYVGFLHYTLKKMTRPFNLYFVALYTYIIPNLSNNVQNKKNPQFS